MNGVAKEFWREVYDLRAPVREEGRDRRAASRARKRAARRLLVRRVGRSAA